MGQTEIKTGRTKSRLWTRDLLLIFILSAAGRICAQMNFTAMPLYVQDLGYSKTMAGLTSTILTIASLPLRPVFGSLMATRSKKAFLIFGTAVYVLVAIMSGMSGVFITIGAFLFIRVVQAFGMSTHPVAASTMFADRLPVDRMTEGLGYYFVCDTMGSALGPTIALAVIGLGSGVSSYPPAFFVSAGIAAVALILCFFVREKRGELPIPAAPEAEKPEGDTASAPVAAEVVEQRPEDAPGEVVPLEKKENLFYRLFEKKALFPSLSMVFFALAICSQIIFLPTFSRETGIDVSMYYFVYAIALLFSQFTLGRFTARLGRAPVLLTATGLFAVGFVVVFFAQNVGVLLAAGVLLGVGYGAIQPSINALCVTGVSTERRGAANSTFYTALDVGFGLGSLLWGVVADAAGIRLIYLLSAVSAVLALVFVCATMGGRSAKKARNSAA
ncbi:MFS transporter [Oscillospiraceae bacterium OttesenSCG-928-F05]|nr:MFS transporter [Oscillospiraceae bacterium OttesenSCG-928-F05]